MIHRIVELAVPNHAAWQLFYDMQVITGMADELPNDTARAQEALYALNQVIDIYDRDDLDASLKKCLRVSHEFLSKKAAPDAHHITAVGNWYVRANQLDCAPLSIFLAMY